MTQLTKYQPIIPDPPEKDLEEAKRLVLQICEAFSANFQNNETDLAHMITDKFTPRNYVKPSQTSNITPTGIEKIVCDDIARRQQVGIKKYGQTVAENPLNLRQWLEHALEEALDLAIYLKRAIVEIDRGKD